MSQRKNKPRKVLPVAPGARFISINQAMVYCSIGHSLLYKIGKEHPGLFKKLGAKTVVDLPVLNGILDKLPAVHPE
jgi:hypothetical protein